jgi:hypothetical protein
MGPLAFMVANLLGTGSIKDLLRHAGEKVAREELERVWRARVEPQFPEIAADMKRDGFTWDGHGGTGTNDEGLGRGFILSRDALYRLIKQTGVIGGWARDGWRDGADNAVFDIVKAANGYAEGMPLEDTIDAGESDADYKVTPGLVRLTFDALLEHTL